ncbi:hypothetical protein JCM3765_001889 [Sporobolomyces pararoseus]
MPLDSNLFCLLVRPRSEAGWIDFLVDNESSEVLYSTHKDANGPSYTLYDPLTSAPYGVLFQPPPSLPNATQSNPKLRSIVLDSPKVDTKLNNVGRLSWEWEFEWQETTYVWTREIVGLLGNERGFTLSVSRRPDPNYPVVTYHPRKKGGSIEILDYNFARVEPAIEDKKGLEITFLLSLCFFLDPLFPTSSVPATPSPQPVASTSSNSSVPSPTPPAVPTRPSNTSSAPPPKRTSSNKLLATNEILIETDSEQALEGYCTKCLSLLEDQSLLYLLLTTKSQPNLSASLVKLAEQVKRKRYKLSGEEIKIFVDDSQDSEDESAEGADRSSAQFKSSSSKKKGNYSPPSNLKIYLSRLELAELLPAYNRKRGQQPQGPILRPPINFDIPPRTDSKTTTQTTKISAGGASPSPATSKLSKKKESSTDQVEQQPSQVNKKSSWFGL